MTQRFFLKNLAGVVILLLLMPFGILQAKEIGTQENFYVQDFYDEKGRSQLTAELINESQRAYFYIERDFWSDLSAFQKNEILEQTKTLSQEFDETIFPKLTSLYGDIWTPGIDFDSKITILLTDMENEVGGYINSEDEFQKTEYPHSNEREMVYLNLDFISSPRLKAFLAHEFQHLISFNQKNRIRRVEDDVWLNELRSEYAPSYLGYDENFRGSNLEARLERFLQRPDDPLIAWSSSTYDYGVLNLFGQYLGERFGSLPFKLSLQNNLAGIKALNWALKQIDKSLGLTRLFQDWSIANFLNNSDLEGGIYAYKNPHLSFKLEPSYKFGGSALTNLEVNFEGSLQPYSLKAYQFYRPKGKDLKVEFVPLSHQGSFVVSVIKEKASGEKLVEKVDFLGDKAIITLRQKAKIKDAFIVPSLINEKDALQKDFFKLKAQSLRLSEPKIFQVRPVTIFSGRTQFVSIEGEDFQEGAEVYFDQRPASQVTYQGSQKLLVKTPSLAKTGVVTLKIQNPDGALTQYKELRVVPSLPQGAIFEALGEEQIYVVKGAFRRPIDRRVLEFYNHLRTKQPLIVTPEEKDSYELSRLIRYAQGSRVYEIGKDGRKHWLKMTPDEFRASGRKWEAVFIVNKAELEYYPEGKPITK